MFKYYVLSKTSVGRILVDPREFYGLPPGETTETLFITISPSPKALTSTILKGKSVKRVPYSVLTFQEQAEYIINYFRRTYYCYFNDNYKMLMTFELNQNGCTHAHVLVYDEDIQNNYDLVNLRKNIFREPLTLSNMSKKGHVDYMNNIVFTNDSLEDRIRYMFKDYNESEAYFPVITNIQQTEEEYQIVRTHKPTLPN